MYLLRDRMAVGGLAGLAAWGGGSLLAYVVLCWVYGLTAVEKRYFTSHATRIFREPFRDESDVP